MADYYVASLYEIEKYGALIKEEEAISALTSEGIQQVAQDIFANKPPVVFHNKPTITYTEFGIVLGLLILLIGYWVFRYISRKRKLKYTTSW